MEKEILKRLKGLDSIISISDRLEKGEKVEGYILCSSCKGSGYERGTMDMCRTCYGYGFLEEKTRRRNG